MPSVEISWEKPDPEGFAGMSVQTHLPAGAGYSTIDLHVRYLRPLLPGQAVEGHGRTVHVGRTLATAEGEARDADGRLLATGTASYHLRGR